MKQNEIFLDGEADGWFVRNRNAIEGEKLKQIRTDDPLLKILGRISLTPARVLEIGASNGWRLAALRERWPQAHFGGIDPSDEAISHAFDGVDLVHGTAEHLPYDDAAFDLVIFGFCLIWCDRADLFRIAAEADRVLEDGGTMVTCDYHTDIPYRNAYHHRPGVHSYKMDYSRLFTWNPAYRVVESAVMPHPVETDDVSDNRVGVFVMRKNLAEGWPLNPWK